ncbi:MAG: hydroxyethylthiazole kinase [Thermoguttaceae bacterium]|nr:hydroxyethylthiazole kinase [Thermoguttaceae bacterium]MBR4105261.1 hydroxyethylthiazole kinase [Thermoguttaceae bacterium]
MTTKEPIWTAATAVEALRNLRRAAPLTHCITNYVTANDCANVLLAFGASPIMADEPAEVEEIVALSSGLVVNLGTLNRSTVDAAFAATRRANELGIPAVLDPVGVGASRLRTETARRLLNEFRFAAIRGNVSEIGALAFGTGSTRGVDAVSESNRRAVAERLREFAAAFRTTVVASGALDLVVDAERFATVRNGSPWAARITGAGCISTAVLGACVAANRARVWEAAVAATAAFGVCGEIAERRTVERGGGTATFRTELIDAASTTEPERFAELLRVETERFGGV